MDPKEIVFRKARLDDIPVMNQISVQSKRHWGYPDSWIEKWNDDLTLNQIKFESLSILLLEIDDQSMGFCAISKEGQDYEIEHLWLLPGLIGKGLGKRLLKESINRFVPKNSRIYVEADPNAEAFYQRQGFKTFDRIESYPKGRFLPRMTRL